MEPFSVRVEETPNPHAAKFVLNRSVGPQGRTYRGDPAAADVPWARALLSIPGVVGLYGVNSFISVNKKPDASWETIVPAAEAALRQAFQEQGA